MVSRGRALLSERVIRQLGDFPAKAFDALFAVMASVVEYPDDPLRTFPMDDPYVRLCGPGRKGHSSATPAFSASAGLRLPGRLDR